MGARRRLVKLERRIRERAYANLGATIGDDVHLARGTKLTARTTIDDHVWVNGAATMRGNGTIRIGSWCAIGDELLITTTNHDISRPNVVLRLHWTHDFIELERPADVTVGPGCWIGDRVTILGGADIGPGCVIAAGAVVPGKTFPPYSVIGGVPAKVIRPRASSDVVQILLTSRWWTWERERQARNTSFFNADITAVAATDLADATND